MANLWYYSQAKYTCNRLSGDRIHLVKMANQISTLMEVWDLDNGTTWNDGNLGKQDSRLRPF